MNEYKIDIHGVKCSIVDSGKKKSDQTILAIHGRLDNAATFFTLWPLMPDYRFIAIDLPGHGKSEHLGAGGYFNYLDIIDTIYVAIQKLNLSHVILLGHSMGGAYCALFASIFPELVSHVISIEALGPLVYSPEKMLNNIKMSIVERNKVKRKNTFMNLEHAISTRAKASHLPNHLMKNIVKRGTLSNEQQQIVWSTDKRVKLPMLYDLNEQQVMQFLAEISCPLLYIEGDKGMFSNDQMITRNQMNKRMHTISDVTKIIIQGGHYLHLENPDKVAQESVNWLKLNSLCLN
ncbi:alpha/beta fold hydrolase [Aliikangiella sp. IMCC44359]|uniref:alpha/beta fold hydrolase n=1 Tax=Aliikangiella sp. IMCC44359 TaxID=3459125 RepID=UPI00403AB6E0